MKTIVENATKLSKYLLSDTSTINSTPENLFVDRDGSLFIICDLTSLTSTIHENITDAPSDWEGNKYTYDGNTWTEVTT